MPAPAAIVGRKNGNKSDGSVLVSTGRRDLRDSEPDPDFDPELISQMSPVLRKQLTTGLFSKADDGVQLERFEAVKPPRCRTFWSRFCCCCRAKDNTGDGEEGVDEESLSTVQRTDTAIYPYDPQPTMESTNLQKKHKEVKQGNKLEFRLREGIGN